MSGSVVLEKPIDSLYLPKEMKILEKMGSNSRDYANDKLPGKKRINICKYQRELTGLQMIKNASQI
jgi:hypothetical protein